MPEFGCSEQSHTENIYYLWDHAVTSEHDPDAIFSQLNDAILSNKAAMLSILFDCYIREYYKPDYFYYYYYYYY